MHTTSAEARTVQTQSAAEAVQTLTQEAAALAAKLSQLTAAVKQSSSSNVSSTLQHIALYDEAVQTLQVVINWLTSSRVYRFFGLSTNSPWSHCLDGCCAVSGKHHSSHQRIT